jgi:hypothetical protein
VNTLTFVDQAPRPKQSSLNLKTEPDINELLKRLTTVQDEDLQRLDSDIDLLTKYLTTQGAPASAVKAIEGLHTKQRENWEDTVARIRILLEK